jgi:hypothetical protein
MSMDVFGVKPYGDYFRERDPHQDGGVLEGDGYRGAYDGPTFDGHSKVNVWNNNQLLTFEIGRVELLRLALGRPVKLATIKGTDLYADVTPEEARAALGRRAYARVLRGVDRLRNRGSGHWGPYQHEYAATAPTPTVEQILSPWLLAIMERLDRLTPSARHDVDHDERCKDRREMLYALVELLNKMVKTHGWDPELLEAVRDISKWVEDDRRQWVEREKDRQEN